MAAPRFNLNNPAVKRILQEMKEMQTNPSDDYMSLPVEEICCKRGSKAKEGSQYGWQSNMVGNRGAVQAKRASGAHVSSRQGSGFGLLPAVSFYPFKEAILNIQDNIFEWQFAVRGPRDTEFEGGIYHGRIQLPPEYPFKPPAFMLLTPNGRFETQTKICLSISQYHPEHWQPSWSVRTALVALIAFMPTKANGAIGSLELSKEERKALALRSIAAPPKYGSGERQKLIDEIHEEMVKRSRPSAVQAVLDGNEEKHTPIDGVNEELDQDRVNMDQEGSHVNEAPSNLEATNSPAPLRESRSFADPALTRPPRRHQASEDLLLTLLAIGLLVALAALLMKKVLKSYSWINI